MTKHILGQAVYQMVVICFALFMGTKFLPSGLNNKTIDISDGLSDDEIFWAANNNGKYSPSKIYSNFF